MKYIVGIDYGSKFCGLARADTASALKIASPWQVIERSKLEDFILKHKDEIDSLVLGLSLNLSGKENPINKEIRNFKEFLENHGFKVYLRDERFTSQAVLAEERLVRRKSKSRKSHKKERLDAGAAALILQSFLDSHSS